MKKLCDKVWNYYIDNIYSGNPDDDLEKVQECKEWLEEIDLMDLSEIIPEHCDYKDPDDVETAAEEVVSMMLKGLNKAEDIMLQQEYPVCSMI